LSDFGHWLHHASRPTPPARLPKHGFWPPAFSFHSLKYIAKSLSHKGLSIQALAVLSGHGRPHSQKTSKFLLSFL
jgi:hypothetical protein